MVHIFGTTVVGTSHVNLRQASCEANVIDRKDSIQSFQNASNTRADESPDSTQLIQLALFATLGLPLQSSQDDKRVEHWLVAFGFSLHFIL